MNKVYELNQVEISFVSGGQFDDDVVTEEKKVENVIPSVQQTQTQQPQQGFLGKAVGFVWTATNFVAVSTIQTAVGAAGAAVCAAVIFGGYKVWGLYSSSKGAKKST